MEDLEQAGLDAVDRFIDTWNSRDAERWAGSLHFPHVRPSPIGEIRVAPNADDYIAMANVNYQKTIDSGWDHSEWDYKHVLHTSPRKIHVAGQWSRYDSDGNVILTTPIVYICTKVDGQWGIQSRFGSDYAGEDFDNTELMGRGLALVQDYINQHNSGVSEAAAELLNYPHFEINVGELDITDSVTDFERVDVTYQLENLMAVQTGQHSMNAAVDVTVSSPAGSRLMQGAVNINNRDGHLGIQAWSFLDPNEPVDD